MIAEKERRFTNTKIQCPVCGKNSLNPTVDGVGGFCHGICNTMIFFDKLNNGTFTECKNAIDKVGFSSVDEIASWYADKNNATFTDSFVYETSEQHPHSAVLRFHRENGNKTYLTIRYTGSTWLIGKPNNLLLYRLPELLHDIAERKIIFICEGERDVDSLRSLGLSATTNPFGATRWDSSFNELFYGVQLVLCSDNDDAGRKRNDLLLDQLREIAAGIHVLDISALCPNTKDITECIDRLKGEGKGSDEIVSMLRAEKTNAVLPFTQNSDKNQQPDYEDDEPKTPPTVVKVERWLSKHYEFRRNVISNFCEYKYLGSSDSWREMDDSEFASIYRKMEHSRLKYSDKRLQKLLKSDFVPTFNPFISYFAELPEWNKQHTIKAVFDRLIVSQHDYEKLYSLFRRWVIHVIACALEYHANDLCLILTGGQGVGKTTFLRSLVPNELSSYYIESQFNPENKDSEIAVCENFLINLDELEAFDRKAVKSLKSIISRDQVKIRRAYGINDTRMKRRASFCGSVNDLQFLVDDTGERRFICIEVSDILRIRVNDEELRQFWAEAYYALQSGEQYRLGKEEMKEITQFNERFKSNSIEYELIAEHFSPTTEKEENARFMTTSNIAVLLREQKDLTGLSVRNIGKALQRLGYEKKSKRLNGGHPVQGYYVKTHF